MSKHKKIALATWLGGPNFGTVLQSYALFKAIEDLGCRATIVTRHDFVYGLKLALGLKKQFPGSATALKSRQMQKRELRTRSFITLFGYKLFCRGCDGAVCGSDQMWNTRYNFNPDFFLANIDGDKKIAYAPSLGTGDFEPSTKEAVKHYLESFRSISVREETGRKAVCALTGRDDVQVVLDPVFLRSRDQWTAFAASCDAVPGGQDYVLCYLLRKNVDFNAIVDRLRTICSTDLVIVVPSYENPDPGIAGARRLDGIGPREFAGLFAGARFVLTDSFHGTAFSLIFHKPMLVLERFDRSDAESQNSRLSDLLGPLGLGNRLLAPEECMSVCSEDGTGCSFLKEPLPWDEVDKKLDALRTHSITYLKDALDNV